MLERSISVESGPKTKTPSKYDDLFKENNIKKCFIRWKPINLKCSGPNCGVISGNRVFVAKIGALRPRYILLCERHRNVLKRETYDFLTMRLGEVISLRKTSPEESSEESSDESDTKLEPIRNKALTTIAHIREKTVSPVVMSSNKRKLDEEDNAGPTKKLKECEIQLKDIENSSESTRKTRNTRSTGPIRDSSVDDSTKKRSVSRSSQQSNDTTDGETVEYTKKYKTWHKIFKPDKKSTKIFGAKRRTRRKSPASDSVSTENDTNSNDVPSQAPPDNTQTPSVPAPEQEDPDVICLDDDSDSNESPSSSSNNVLLSRKCCIPACKSMKSDAVIKIGEAPNFEYLVVCSQHRDCLKNVQAIAPIKVESNYILEEGEVPPSPPAESTMNLPEEGEILNHETLSELEKTISNESFGFPPPIISSPLREETIIPVQRVEPTVLNSKDPIELNANGAMLVSRKCIAMTGPSGVPKTYILEEWGDGSIIYTPAPPGLPLGNCTQEQIAFYKTKQTQRVQVSAPKRHVPTQKSQQRPSTSQVTTTTPSIDQNQILSRHHIQSANASPVLPTADVSKSELVYIQGQPFLLTSVQGLGITPQATPQSPPVITSKVPIVHAAAPSISVTSSSIPKKLPQPLSNTVKTIFHHNKQNLAQNIQRNVTNRIGNMTLPKNLTVRLQQHTSQPTFSASIVSEQEPEEILSDPIPKGLPVPVALTRVGQGPAQQGLQIMQKTGTAGPMIRNLPNLPSKTNSNNSNIRISFVKGSKTVSSTVATPVVKTSVVRTTPTVKVSTLPAKSALASKPTLSSNSSLSAKPNLPDYSTLPIVSVAKISSARPVGKTSKPVSKPLVSRPGPLSSKSSQSFVISEPRSLSKPSVSRKRSSESPPPTRVTRLSSQNTPPKQVQATQETIKPSSSKNKPSSSNLSVVKTIDINKDTTLRRISSSESRDSRSNSHRSQSPPFSLTVTSIPADDDDFDLDDDDDDWSSTNIDIQLDSEDPMDPLSVKTMPVIDLDGPEQDPLGGNDSFSSSTSSSNKSSSKEPVRRGSLPFPSTIRKRQ